MRYDANASCKQANSAELRRALSRAASDRAQRRAASRDAPWKAMGPGGQAAPEDQGQLDDAKSQQPPHVRSQQPGVHAQRP